MFRKCFHSFLIVARVSRIPGSKNGDGNRTSVHQLYSRNTALEIRSDLLCEPNSNRRIFLIPAYEGQDGDLTLMPFRDLLRDWRHQTVQIRLLCECAGRYRQACCEERDES